MKLFIDNLIPRLKEYSSTLDKKEIFVDIPWIVIDENLNRQKYIFKRNGELIISFNSQVKIGKWEYISGAKSLLIDRIQDKILLGQNFIDPAVMILRLDGIENINFILANEILIPNLDVTDYLRRIYYEKNNIVAVSLKNGGLIELNNFNKDWTYVNNTKVTIDGEPIPDGILELAKAERKYVIKNSRIDHVLVVKKSYTTNKGDIIIEQQYYHEPSYGDFVFQNNVSAPDGKYRFGFMKSLVVKGGRISKKSFWW